MIARRDTALYRFTKFVQRHRVGVSAAALVTLALVGWGITAASGWAAERRHNQVVSAERDRTRRMLDEALELAHVFIFDFYDEIRPLDGTLVARKMLAENAQQCLEDLRPDVGDDPELLRELAAAYDKVGDIWRPERGASFGDTSVALANYETAMDMRRVLVADHPDDRDLRRAMARGHWRIGLVLRATGDVEGALAAYRKDLEISEALAELDPKYRLDHAVALADVGAALKDQGRIEEARRHYEQSLALREQVLADDADDARALRAVGIGHMHVAEARELSGDIEGALAMYLTISPHEP